MADILKTLNLEFLGRDWDSHGNIVYNVPMTFKIPFAKANPAGTDIRALVNYILKNKTDFIPQPMTFVKAKLVTETRIKPTITKTVLTIPMD